jgi:hypothetical protein
MRGTDIMSTETFIHLVLAVMVLLVPLACAYIVVRRIARRNAPHRERENHQ